MEENKLTDEEIVQVLDGCFAKVGEMSCEGCKVVSGEGLRACMRNVGRHSLELIHRLQDENKALLKENEALTISFYGVQNQARERCNELQKLVDELKQRLNAIYGKKSEVCKDVLNMYLGMFINEVLPKIMYGHDEKALQIACSMIEYGKEFIEGVKQKWQT